MSRFMVQLKPGSVLMSMACVATEEYLFVHGLCSKPEATLISVVYAATRGHIVFDLEV